MSTGDLDDPYEPRPRRRTLSEWRTQHNFGRTQHNFVTTGDQTDYLRQPSSLTGVFLILDAATGRVPTPEPDPVRWQRWMSHSPFRVLKQEVLRDGTRVSTVFVGVASCLWETEVAGGPADHNEHMSYATYAAAEAGHTAIVAELSRGSRGIRFREEER